jgi:hypothetical protein
MADPLSIAAGVAGLIGLSGQIFSGCLLAKSFLDDVKNAPKDITALKSELETLSMTAKSFERLVDGCRVLEPNMKQDSATVLKQCLDAVDSLKKYVETECKDGKGVRNRIKVAGKNSTIEKCVVKLSRLNAAMQATQNNVSM